MSVNDIAAAVHLTPEEVQRHIDQYERDRDEMREIYLSAVLKRCAWSGCGKEIEPHSAYSLSGSLAYHTECFRKMSTRR